MRKILLAMVVSLLFANHALALTCGSGQTLKRMLIQDADVDTVNDSIHVVGKQGAAGTVGSNTCSQTYDTGLPGFDSSNEDDYFTAASDTIEQVVMFLDASANKPARMPYAMLLGTTRQNPGKKAVSVSLYDPSGITCEKSIGGVNRVFLRVEVCFLD
jgi:hypothetical protein